jgi:ribosomal protein L7/L12
MRWVKKAIAGLLLGVGLPICILAIAKLKDKNAPSYDRYEAFLALVLFGALPTTSGSFLIWNLHQQDQKEKSDRLYQTFFQLIKIGQGRISVLDFALRTQLSGEAAKAYLDERAREFDAMFDVSENGGVFYHFILGDATLKILAADDAATYDIILKAMPEDSRQVIRTLRQLTGKDWQEVKAMVRRLPVTVSRGVNQATAEQFRTQLEAVGAQVTVSLT